MNYALWCRHTMYVPTYAKQRGLEFTSPTAMKWIQRSSNRVRAATEKVTTEVYSAITAPAVRRTASRSEVQTQVCSDGIPDALDNLCDEYPRAQSAISRRHSSSALRSVDHLRRGKPLYGELNSVALSRAIYHNGWMKEGNSSESHMSIYLIYFHAKFWCL